MAFDAGFLAALAAEIKKIALGGRVEKVYQPEQEIGQLAAGYLIERLSGYTGEPRITRLKCNIEPK